MLALLAVVFKVKAGITCNLVSLGLADTPLLPGCQPHLLNDGSKPPLSFCVSSFGFWLEWDSVWQSPFFSAESPLITIELTVGKLALRLSYLLLPLFSAQWKLFRSNILDGKEGSLGELSSGCPFLTMLCY